MKPEPRSRCDSDATCDRDSDAERCGVADLEWAGRTRVLIDRDQNSTRAQRGCAADYECERQLANVPAVAGRSGDLVVRRVGRRDIQRDREAA